MEFRYASFWQRFAAVWIDAVVLAPLIAGFMWIESSSRLGALAIELPRMAIFMGYTIYAHGRFGKTVGKHLMGIRIVRTDGQRMGWWEAWLRSAPDLMLSAVSAAVRMSALLAPHQHGVSVERENVAAKCRPGKRNSGLVYVARVDFTGVDLERVHRHDVQSAAAGAA